MTYSRQNRACGRTKACIMLAVDGNRLRLSTAPRDEAVTPCACRLGKLFKSSLRRTTSFCTHFRCQVMPGPIETLRYDPQKNRNFINMFLLMSGSNHWISQNLTIQFDFPWNQQMRNILEYRFRTGTSCFKWSDFEKYSKYHPKLNEKLVSSARRAKPDLARNAPASIITLRDRALRVNVLKAAEPPGTHHDHPWDTPDP